MVWSDLRNRNHLEFVFDYLDTVLKNLVFASFSDLLTGCEFKLNEGLGCCQVQDRKVFRSRELYKDQSYVHIVHSWISHFIPTTFVPLHRNIKGDVFFMHTRGCERSTGILITIHI